MIGPPSHIVPAHVAGLVSPIVSDALSTRDDGSIATPFPTAARVAPIAIGATLARRRPDLPQGAGL